LPPLLGPFPYRQPQKESRASADHESRAGARQTHGGGVAAQAHHGHRARRAGKRPGHAGTGPEENRLMSRQAAIGVQRKPPGERCSRTQELERPNALDLMSPTSRTSAACRRIRDEFEKAWCKPCYMKSHFMHKIFWQSATTHRQKIERISHQRMETHTRRKTWHFLRPHGTWPRWPPK